ncbi:SDR family oxidoreductase [Corynebacterium terpenotabidum]|uniref:Putative short-chain type oxidoreductase n=1 Tax=Corynebacterium terpenotabidum Y-11 TaxID=1200352 RepID=S4XFK0_9CORY|nr:SDR family oxidoreductase [Corynebacterium terpenotabidum]AGP31907.1 putative short-chain type oxidoreductase [Corynebacterium terpenotabidum Y-11]
MTAENQNTHRRLAVVTGASAGIGEATAVALAVDGWDVVLAARRPEKLDAVAARIATAAPDATTHVLPVDVTDRASVDALAATVAGIRASGGLDLLVNNAGGARGLDSVLDGDVEDWRWMYEANVIGTLQVTQALFGALAKGTAPQVINIVSIAGRWGYRGGAGYNAAKFGETALSDVMRIEFAEAGVRVCQIDPGRVATEFSLNRFKGDATKADAVYRDVLNLQADDIAETVRWVADRPAHMDVDTVMIRPTDQNIKA